MPVLYLLVTDGREMDFDSLSLLLIQGRNVFFPKRCCFPRLILPSAGADDVLVDLGATSAAELKIFLGEYE
jgi:hypothetical protein